MVLAASPEAEIALTDLLGAVAVLGESSPVNVRISVADLLGSCKAVVAAANTAHLSTTNLLGYCRAHAKSSGAPWPGAAEIGPGPCGYGDLPLPTKDGYEYSTNPMLSRTEFESGVIRQRRRGDSNYKPASATVMVTGAQLVTLEGVLASVGVEWWNLPMITGDSAGAVALHTVRVTGPLTYSMIEYDLFKASFELEIQ